MAISSCNRGWGQCNHTQGSVAKEEEKHGYWGKKLVSATNATVEKCGHVNWMNIQFGWFETNIKTGEIRSVCQHQARSLGCKRALSFVPLCSVMLSMIRWRLWEPSVHLCWWHRSGSLAAMNQDPEALERLSYWAGNNKRKFDRKKYKIQYLDLKNKLHKCRMKEP